MAGEYRLDGVVEISAVSALLLCIRNAAVSTYTGWWNGSIQLVADGTLVVSGGNTLTAYTGTIPTTWIVDQPLSLAPGYYRAYFFEGAVPDLSVEPLGTADLDTETVTVANTLGSLGVAVNNVFEAFLAYFQGGWQPTIVVTQGSLVTTLTITSTSNGYPVWRNGNFVVSTDNGIDWTFTDGVGTWKTSINQYPWDASNTWARTAGTGTTPVIVLPQVLNTIVESEFTVVN